MTKTIGFRVYLNTPRPAADIVAGFRGVPTGNVCDAMDRIGGAMHYRIRPLDSGYHMVGSALTVRTRPGDNLMIWKAIDVAQPGDVLVIDAHSFTSTSAMGDLLVTAAQAKGIAGLVCDGMCRDSSGIRATGLPVYCIGSIPSSPGKDGPGEIGAAISCGDAVVHPGDIIVGDDDGVVVVPRTDAPGVLQQLKVIEEKEAQSIARIQAGNLIPATIDETLRAKGCEFIN